MGDVGAYGSRDGLKQHLSMYLEMPLRGGENGETLDLSKKSDRRRFSEALLLQAEQVSASTRESPKLPHMMQNRREGEVTQQCSGFQHD